MSARQYAAGATTLAAIKTTYTLKVTGVTTDQLNTVVANTKVKHVEVADTGSNIGTKFENLLSRQPNKIDSVTQTDTGAIALTSDQFTRGTVLGIIGKLNSGAYTLALSDAKVLGLTDITNNTKVTSVAVKDTSAHIATALANLGNAKITSIVQTDATGSITITDSLLQANSAALGKLVGISSLAVTGVTAARASTVAANANVKSVSVTDTAANVYSNSVANALVSKLAATNIADSAANISSRFTDIAGLSGITKINLTDSANITITGAQLKDNSVLLAKVYDSNDLKGHYHLTVTGVSAAEVIATAKLSTVNKINVSDTVAHALTNLTALKTSKVDNIDLTGTGALIASNIDKLDGLGAKLASVTNDDGGDINLNYDQYVKRSATLAKIDTGSFVVSDVGASMAKQLMADTKVSSISVKDSAAKISANYSNLKDVLTASKLGAVQLTDAAAVTMTATQYVTASGLLDKVKDAAGGSNFTLQITGALATDLIALYTTSNHFGKVTKVSISDSSSNISAKLADLGTAYSTSKLGTISLTDADAIVISKGQLLDTPNIAGALTKIYGANNVLGNYTLDVTGVSAAGASSLLSSNTKVAKVSVADTSANISSSLTSVAAITASKLKAVTVSDYLTDEIDITASNLALSSYTTVLGKVSDGNYKLNVLDVSASQAKVLTTNNTKVSHLTVQDTGTSISAKLADLNGLADANKLTAITLTDPANTIVLTATQYDDNNASALGILNPSTYKLSISGVTVADAADDAKKVNADLHVVSYSVKDEGATIVADLVALDTRVKLQSINWTDTTTALEITGTQYNHSIGTLSKINGGEYDAHIADLSAADTAAAESDANISEFSVKDTAANLGTYLSALQTSASATTVKVQAIDHSDTDDVAMTYALYAASTDALAMMTDSSITWTVSDVAAADVATVIGDAQVQTITVKDTASAIVDKLGTSATAGDLDTNEAKITAITVSDGAVLALSGSQYADNPAVLGKLGAYHTTITDLAGANVHDATIDNTHVDSFAVKDDAAGLGTNFSHLVSAGTKLTDITQNDTDDISISLSDLAANASDYAATLSKFAVKPTISLT